MIIIVCIDDKFGVMFDGKRQSRDRGLIDDLMTLAKGRRVVISTYSAPLFEGREVSINEKTFDVAEEGDFVFIEDGKLLRHLDKIDEIVMYKWNRTYPRDALLDLIPEEHGFKLIDSCDFVGSSHKKITREVYRK